MEKANWDDTTTEIRVFTKWIISSVLDGAFVALWAIIQWGVQEIILKFSLSGVDSWMLRVFQFLFALTTLLPILVYIYVDATVMILRARKRIQEERRNTNEQS